MRIVVVLLIAVAVALGCGGKPTPAPAPPDTKPSAPAAAQRDYPPPTTKYEGHTADYWGERALDANEGTADRAIGALAALGREGIPYLLTGIKEHAKADRLQQLASCIGSVQGRHLAPDDVAMFGEFIDAKYAYCDSGVWLIRWQALAVITDAGPKAKSLIPQLEQLAKEPKFKVKAEAAIRAARG